MKTQREKSLEELAIDLGGEMEATLALEDLPPDLKNWLKKMKAKIIKKLKKQ